MQTSQYLGSGRLGRSSYSSTTPPRNSLLNGLISSHRLSETFPNSSSLTSNSIPNEVRLLNNSKIELFRSKKVEDMILIVCLTLIFAFLFLITIELSTRLVKYSKDEDILLLTNNLSSMTNETTLQIYQKSPIHFFFGCVWLFNLLLFIICLFLHICIYQRRSQRNRPRPPFLREFGRIFSNGQSSSTNPLVDYLLKTCLLCLLWYFSCYLMFRSMSILVSFEIIILYSITITLREVLGWIFLHELFLGNKIIAHILSLSTLLFLAHNDRFRFNRFLFGLTMVTSSVTLKTIFDVLINAFVKDLTTSKLRMIMINVCLCGTCLLWPFPLLFHFTQIEPIEIRHFNSIRFLITLICGLIFNVLKITISIKYTSISNITSLLVLIPSISLIDYYLFNIKYSSLTLLSILCSFVAVLLSLIPDKCFQTAETTTMKQILAFINKDYNTNSTIVTSPSGGTTTTGRSSAFEQIRAQRRITNAFLHNEMNT